MDIFINRGPELRLIEEAFDDLLNKEAFLHTPIIDFYGVKGIGKTSILKKVVQTCNHNKIRYIQADASQSSPAFFQEIINQARQYNGTPPPSNPDNLRDQFVIITRELLKKGPLVILLDEVDTTSANKLESIEEMLGDLVMDERL